MNEQKQLKNIDEGINELNIWYKVNTIATCVIGVANLVIAYLLLKIALWKNKNYKLLNWKAERKSW